MEGLFKTCPKIVFRTFLVLFEIRLGGGGDFDQRETGKILCLRTGKMGIFPIYPFFSTCPSQKSGTSSHL